MATSNLYSSRIFAEHPLALWSLDDPIYFKSLLSAEQLDPKNFVIEEDQGSWLEEYFTPLNLPVKTSQSAVLGRNTSASLSYTQIHSASIQYEELDATKDTICISGYVWEYGSLIDFYEIGFLYSNGQVDSITTNSLGNGPWQKIQHTSTIPDEEVSVMPFIKVNYIEGGSGLDYDVMFNSVSVGQWSEEHLNYSQGSIPQNLTGNFFQFYIPDVGYKVIPLDPYGFNDGDTGYVFVDENKVLATNNNFSMVYGSDNITNVHAAINEGLPSIALPGKGFLNSRGQYSELTLEFWLRINPISLTNKRILGPISSKDGLYVDKEFITLKIGQYSKSYFVGKWYRPMLIDIRYSQNLVSLLINGDVAIEMEIDASKFDLPSLNLDWIGIYGDENLFPFEIDAIAIFPYIVPEQLAKKRFIYGQAVLPSENIVQNFGGGSMFVDFPFSQYSATINYPDMNPWNAGDFNNLDANSKYVGFKKFRKPEFKFVGNAQSFIAPVDIRDWTDFQLRTWLEWLSYTWQGTQAPRDPDIFVDNFYSQISGSPAFFQARPNIGYDNVSLSIEFETIGLTSDKVSSIYGIFQVDELPTSTQMLMHFYNSINQNYFDITVDSENIKYIYNGEIIHEDFFTVGEPFFVGFNIERLVRYKQEIIGNFFSNTQNLSLTLLNTENNQFLGKFYSLTFDNTFYTIKNIESKLSQDGFIGSTISEEDFDIIGSYTLKSLKDESSFVLDVCAAGYWEDSIPLSYFGKLIKTAYGTSYYDLDMLQFNIDYPSSVLTSPSSSSQFYVNENIRTYITLQDKFSVGKVPYSRYTNIENISNSRVLDFDNTDDVIETKFEISDGTIIFPPKELVNFEDYYITIHIEIKSERVNDRSLRIRKMSISSISKDEKELFAIGTSSGEAIYPISKYGNIYSYKDKNPFRIYKDSTPYLYLTGDSGVSLMPYDSELQRGFSVLFNSNRSNSYTAAGFQFWGMYNKDSIISSTTKIARFVSQNRIYDFYLEPIDNGKRGVIKAFDGVTGLVTDLINVINDPIVFYQDGERIKYPVITPMKWTSIVVSFGEEIEFTSVVGQLEFYEGFLYNNLATFQKTSFLFSQDIEARIWQEVRSAQIVINGEIVTIDYEWEDWTPSQWEEVYSAISTRSPISTNLNGKSLTSSYLGTSSIIVDDSSRIVISSNEVDIISDVIWDRNFVKPV
jgi:hypothetical protein